jgi:hypothetical protein
MIFLIVPFTAQEFHIRPVAVYVNCRGGFMMGTREIVGEY